MRRRGEYQLEERNEVAEKLLQFAQRTISAVGSDEHAFTDQRRRSNVQQTSAATAQRTPPHVGDGKQLLYGDCGVGGPKRPTRLPTTSSLVLCRALSCRVLPLYFLATISTVCFRALFHLESTPEAPGCLEQDRSNVWSKLHCYSFGQRAGWLSDRVYPHRLRPNRKYEMGPTKFTKAATAYH